MFLAVAQHSIAVLGVLMCVGGLVGYAKAGSKASMAAGLGSGVALLGTYALTYTDVKLALIIALVISASLDAVFSVRLAKTKKVMPSGVLLALNVIVQVILVLGLVEAFK
ncbi:MAG TPA: TMEM14 family protein [Candidatus Obscuribacterales bacterium]